jgi:hypothetical protein
LRQISASGKSLRIFRRNRFSPSGWERRRVGCGDAGEVLDFAEGCGGIHLSGLFFVLL